MLRLKCCSCNLFWNKTTPLQAATRRLSQILDYFFSLCALFGMYVEAGSRAFAISITTLSLAPAIFAWQMYVMTSHTFLSGVRKKKRRHAAGQNATATTTTTMTATNTESNE